MPNHSQFISTHFATSTSPSTHKTMKRSFCDISLDNILDDYMPRQRRRTEYYVDPNYLNIMTKDVPIGELWDALHDENIPEDSLHGVTVDVDYDPDADDNGCEWMRYEEENVPYWFCEDDDGNEDETDQ